MKNKFASKTIEAKKALQREVISTIADYCDELDNSKLDRYALYSDVLFKMAQEIAESPIEEEIGEFGFDGPRGGFHPEGRFEEFEEEPLHGGDLGVGEEETGDFGFNGPRGGFHPEGSFDEFEEEPLRGGDLGVGRTKGEDFSAGLKHVGKPQNNLLAELGLDEDLNLIGGEDTSEFRNETYRPDTKPLSLKDSFQFNDDDF